eukprot:EG_transcript_23660
MDTVLGVLVLCCFVLPAMPRPKPQRSPTAPWPAFDGERVGFGWPAGRPRNAADFLLFGVPFHEVEGAPWNAWDNTTRSWKTHKVMVIAIYKEFVKTGLPRWILNSTVARRRTVYFYQRLDPTGPRFAPNFGQEGGVLAKFVNDFYPNLPNITILLQAEPSNRLFLRNVDCLRPDAPYASMNPWATRTRRHLPKASPAESVWFETCVRDVLRAVGQPLAPGASFLPLSFTMSDQFAVAKRVLLRLPHRAWQEVYQRLGKGPVCSTRQ